MSRSAPTELSPFAVEQIAQGAKLAPDPIARLFEYFCGCGDHEAAWTWVKTYLRMLAEDQRPLSWKPESGPEYLATYLLDYLGFTEHGATIRTPWLETPGREALVFLEEFGVDWQDKAWWIDAAGLTLSMPQEIP